MLKFRPAQAGKKLYTKNMFALNSPTRHNELANIRSYFLKARSRLAALGWKYFSYLAPFKSHFDFYNGFTTGYGYIC